jgi:exopolysaccharide biosynthesis polyprenyl glycosylphosphotransferase
MLQTKFKYLYIASDFIAAAIAWSLFYIFRKVFIESHFYGHSVPLQLGYKFVAGIIIIPLIWIVLYYSTGYYHNVLRKSRLEDLGNTFIVSVIGVIIIFFSFILDDVIGSYKGYYEAFVTLFLIHFTLTFLPRILITSLVVRLERKGRIRFTTLMVGRPDRLLALWTELNARYPGHGHHVIGYIPTVEHDQRIHLPMEMLGEAQDIHHLIKERNIEDVIIGLEETDIELYHKIVYHLNSSNVVVKVNPELYPVVKDRVVIASLFRYPLLEVSRNLMPAWQVSLKQLIDVIGSVVGLTLSLPICMILAVIIKLTSSGSIIYSHERIGRFGKPFRIYKFRSMYKDAEDNGPQLATTFDKRITPVGKIMRRYKLDEIPNFFNVLRGDMSLVGPRPERQFYIDQIVVRTPEYTRLLKIKPGVTSWGQVRYGYAGNVDEMVRRTRYDLLYLENMSLFVDFQILIHTILTIFRGERK